MKPCIPPELQAVADEAERRKMSAIERHLQTLAVETGALEEPPDPFLRSMAELIEADKRVVISLKERRRA